MLSTASPLRLTAAALAFVGVGLLCWWFLGGADAVSRSSESSSALPAPLGQVDESPGGVELTAPIAGLTPEPTVVPTPTPLPTPAPLGIVVPLAGLDDLVVDPLAGCGMQRIDDFVAGTVALTCIEQQESAGVVAVAAGRVVHIATGPAVDPARLGGLIDRDGNSGEWSWAEQALLGPHVVIDHAQLGGARSVQTVYAGLDTVADGLFIGASVEQGEALGTVGGPQPVLRFSLWRDDVRQDGATVLAPAPSIEAQRRVAEGLGPIVSSPTDERCPLVVGIGQLPGAPREYRNGVHRGIDFGCGAGGRYGHALADGIVVYLVDDYADPTVANREALLEVAGDAGFTPHWMLVMLYGNVVIIDHGDIAGVGRVVTIYAHLETVDDGIELGEPVERDQVIGELGNRGTNAAALGIRGDEDPSLHLHWELFIDNWYLGADLGADEVSELITTVLCGQAGTPGCSG